jgi:hypothetical protein
MLGTTLHTQIRVIIIDVKHTPPSTENILYLLQPQQRNTVWA